MNARWVRRQVINVGGVAHRFGTFVTWLTIIWASTVAFANDPISSSSHDGDRKIPVAADQIDDEISTLLRTGLELEDAGQWDEAIVHYGDAAKRFPENRQIYQRLLISRLHSDVQRRYRDSTFLQAVREMTTAQALDLYSEVLANLQAHYVDEIDWARVLLHGTAALEVALWDDGFILRTLPGVDRDRIEYFRQNIHHRIASRSTQTRFDLRATVATVADLAHAELGLSGTATVFEFISGSVSTLDPYTRLLSPGQLEEMFSSIEGNFVGLGVELKADADGLLILSVIPGGPADAAGIVAGERIISVAGASIDDHDPDYVADLLKGVDGTSVDVQLESADQRSRTLSIVRRRVEVPCVENVHLVESGRGIGYFRLTNFQKTTPREIEAALWKLHRDCQKLGIAGGLQSLILDLRDNPGGLLSAAVEAADLFLADGAILTTRGRNPRENFSYTAHRPNTWRVPLVVLIDENSASASEIFSGAIRDRNRGTVIGQTSYGKGRVQGIFPMQSTRFGLCLTTAKFYSPSGRAISQNGIEPHIRVAPTQITARPDLKTGRMISDLEDSVLQRGIAHLRGHGEATAFAVAKPPVR